MIGGENAQVADGVRWSFPDSDGLEAAVLGGDSTRHAGGRGWPPFAVRGQAEVNRIR